MSKFVLACVAMCMVELDAGAYSVVVTKYAKKVKTDPLIFCLYRNGFCFPLLFLIAYVFRQKIIPPSKREIAHLMLIGGIGMFANQLCFILGVYYTSVDTTALFRPLTPFCAMVLAVMFQLESMPALRSASGFSKIIGIIFALFGALTVVESRKGSVDSKGSSDEKTYAAIGYIFLSGNALCTGLYITLQKKLIYENPNSILRNQAISVTAWSYFSGFVCMAVASLFYINEPSELYLTSKESIILLIYTVVISSAFSYILQSWSTIHLNSTLVSSFWPLQIFCSVILAYFVLGEVLNVKESLGGLLMIVGLGCVIWSNYMENKNFRSTEPKYDKL